LLFALTFIYEKIEEEQEVLGKKKKKLYELTGG
jgi:hypothetical protein